MPIDLRLDPNEIPLLTDLYELTMAASYFALRFNRPACFGMSVRRLPPRRGFLVSAGLERLLEVLFRPDRSGRRDRGARCAPIQSNSVRSRDTPVSAIQRWSPAHAASRAHRVARSLPQLA